MTKIEFKKKMQNYWFYYKIHTIVAVIAIIIVAVLVTQCVKTDRPDMTVMMISKNVSLTEEQVQKVQNMLSKYTADTNNDGKKIVTLDVITIDDDNNAQMAMASRQKMTAEIAATDNTVYILDDEFYNFLNQNDEFIADLKDINSKAGSTKRVKLKDIKDFNIDDLQKYYGDLTISARVFDGVSPTKSEKASVKNLLKQILDSYSGTSN
jgi:uncharacterized protein YxeA